MRRASIIWAIVLKDLREFSRDRFFFWMTVAGLALYVGLFWVLPNTVNETIRVAVHHPGMDALFAAAGDAGGQGIEFAQFGSSGELRTALGMAAERPDEKFDIGLEFPPDFLRSVAAGERTTVRVYVDGAVPPEVRDAISGFVREMAYALAGNALPVAEPGLETVVLGEDRAGRQVSLREKMRPLAAFLVLMVETLALGSLLAGEIQTRTVTAVAVTRATVSDFLVAKAILGTLLAFVQVALLMLMIGSLGANAPILLVAVLFGAVLSTGIALFTGASGKDFIGLMFYNLVFLIPLMIPALASLYPGSASVWVKVLPSYGLAETIVRATTYGAGWREVLPYLGMLLGWCAALFAAGLFVLRRKVESL